MSPLGPMPVGIVNVEVGTSMVTNRKARPPGSAFWLAKACADFVEPRCWRKLGWPGVRGDLMDCAALRTFSSSNATAKNVNERILRGWVMMCLLKPFLTL